MIGAGYLGSAFGARPPGSLTILTGNFGAADDGGAAVEAVLARPAGPTAIAVPTTMTRRTTRPDRVRNRLNWGRTSEVQAPELETRLAILRPRAETDLHRGTAAFAMVAFSVAMVS